MEIYSEPTVLMSLKTDVDIYCDSDSSCVTSQHWRRNPFCPSTPWSVLARYHFEKKAYGLRLSYSGYENKKELEVREHLATGSGWETTEAGKKGGTKYGHWED